MPDPTANPFENLPEPVLDGLIEQAIDYLLHKLVRHFDLGTMQLFERLETDAQRMAFLLAMNSGVHITAPAKVKSGAEDSLTDEERKFCGLMTEVFAGESMEQFLQRPRQLAIGWANEFLTPSERRVLINRLDDECGIKTAHRQKRGFA